jgi:hypothetical protein
MSRPATEGGHLGDDRFRRRAGASRANRPAWAADASWSRSVRRAFAVPSLCAVSLAAFAAGLWGSYRDVFPARGLYRVTGIFEARGGESLIMLRHDAIPGLMDEMSSMALLAESKELLDRAALRRGDHVRFTIRQLPDKLLVVEIQKIP